MIYYMAIFLNTFMSFRIKMQILKKADLLAGFKPLLSSISLA